MVIDDLADLPAVGIELFAERVPGHVANSLKIKNDTKKQIWVQRSQYLESLHELDGDSPYEFSFEELQSEGCLLTILSPGVDVEKFFNDKATGNGAPLHNVSKLWLALEELGICLS